jgi:hypothetical protein
MYRRYHANQKAARAAAAATRQAEDAAWDAAERGEQKPPTVTQAAPSPAPQQQPSNGNKPQRR